MRIVSSLCLALFTLICVPKLLMRPRHLSRSKQCCQVNEQIKCNWWSQFFTNVSCYYYKILKITRIHKQILISPYLGICHVRLSDTPKHQSITQQSRQAGGLMMHRVTTSVMMQSCTLLQVLRCSVALYY